MLGANTCSINIKCKMYSHGYGNVHSREKFVYDGGSFIYQKLEISDSSAEQ